MSENVCILKIVFFYKFICIKMFDSVVFAVITVIDTYWCSRFNHFIDWRFKNVCLQFFYVIHVKINSNRSNFVFYFQQGKLVLKHPIIVCFNLFYVNNEKKKLKNESLHFQTSLLPFRSLYHYIMIVSKLLKHRFNVL